MIVSLLLIMATTPSFAADSISAMAPLSDPLSLEAMDTLNRKWHSEIITIKNSMPSSAIRFKVAELIQAEPAYLSHQAAPEHSFQRLGRLLWSVVETIENEAPRTEHPPALNLEWAQLRTRVLSLVSTLTPIPSGMRITETRHAFSRIEFLSKDVRDSDREMMITRIVQHGLERTDHWIWNDPARTHSIFNETVNLVQTAIRETDRDSARRSSDIETLERMREKLDSFQKFWLFIPANRRVEQHPFR